MSPVMRFIWLFFMVKKKLGLSRLGRPARAAARPTRSQLKGLALETNELGGFQLDIVRSSSAPQRAVIYLHGGGYVQPIAKQHWDLITKISRETRSVVYVPRYG
ncbi:MAG: hypothetical protein VW959_02740, partial [Aquiluna sp.]